MELLTQFKKYLLQDKPRHSKVTVKNYLADVRKFINWFEATFHTEFMPQLISKQLADIYKKHITNPNSQSQIPAARSVKRYLSSLRKFYSFMLLNKLVSQNPFEIEPVKFNLEVDLFHLKEFKNYLLLANASRVTRKNYLMDISHFVGWLKKLPDGQNLNKINSALIEEYKNRLLYEAGFAPASVNRKLSSLRKYFSWLRSKKLIANELVFDQVSSLKKEDGELITIAGSTERSFSPVTEPANEFIYSAFPPVRLLQKLFRFSNWGFDLLIISPVVKTTSAIKYQLWKLGGRKVFTNPIDQLITQQKQLIVKSIPKSFYAPLRISTKGMAFYRRIIYYLRHTRPLWYKKYHSYRFAHYLHFCLLLTYSVFLGFKIYDAVLVSPRMQPAVLGAEQSAARVLAFSGRLTDATGTPITTSSHLRFSLYDDRIATGSSLLWQENQTIKPDHDGNFQTLLGQHQAISQSFLTDSLALFLGITIGNKEELKPRQQIATIVYSKDSGKLQGMLPITDPNAGTSNIILALDSSGNLTIGGKASPRFEVTGGEFTLSGRTLTLTTGIDSNSNIQLSPDGSGIIDIQKQIQNTTNYGIIPDVEGMVQIADSLGILAESGTHSALLINQNGTGNLISASGSGTAKFTVDYLGAGMFADDLAVNGNSLTSDSYTFNLLNSRVINLNIGSDASAVSIGATSGATLVNNSLRVKGTSTLEGEVKAIGRINATGGLTIAQDKNLTLDGFTPGSLTFIGNEKQITQDVNNLFWDQTNKRLGVGTITPSFRLGIQDDQTSSVVSQIYNSNTGSDADGLSIKLGNASATTVDNSNHFINFETAGAGIVGSIKGNGSNGIQIAFNSPGDWAEYIKKDTNETVLFGSLVCIKQDGKATACDDLENKILGVASEHPTIIAGENLGDASVPVGFTGIVKAFVSSENGDIKPGDLITSSYTPGIGVKAVQKGMIVGRSLEAYENSNLNEIGSVLIALQISWYDPGFEFNQDGDVTLKESQSPISLKPTNDSGFVSLSDIDSDLSTLNFQLSTFNSINLPDSQPTLSIKLEKDKLVFLNSSALDEKDQIYTVNSPIASSSAIASIDAQGNASFSGTLRAKKIIADEIEGLDSKLATLAALINTTKTNNTYNTIATASSSQEEQRAKSKEQIVATNSAIPTTLSPMPYALRTNTDFARFDQGLMALGASSLTDVSITGSLFLGQGTFFSENAINTIGPNLELQPLRQGNLSIMGELVTIDTEGNLKVNGNASFAKDVQVEGVLSANIISPIPDSDLIIRLGNQESGIRNQGHDSSFIIHDSNENEVFNLSNLGDLIASGSGRFKNLATEAITIIRGAQADTSLTEAVADGSAGMAVIEANQKERTIKTPYVKKDSLIYISPTSDTQGAVPYVARQVAETKTIKGSFTIQIPRSITKDIKINWWIIN